MPNSTVAKHPISSSHLSWLATDACGSVRKKKKKKRKGKRKKEGERGEKEGETYMILTDESKSILECFWSWLSEGERQVKGISTKY